MSTLAEFLLSRIAEREALARAATPGPWEAGNPYGFAGVTPRQFGEGRCAYCANHGEPTWTGRADINGTRMMAHEHRLAEGWPDGITGLGPNGSHLAVVVETDEYGLMEKADQSHIAANDPAFVLAECAALRAVVEWHGAVLDNDGGWDDETQKHTYTWQCEECGMHGEYDVPYPCRTLRALAQPYAAHPAFDPSWKVDA